jgi:hypothetical protein
MIHLGNVCATEKQKGAEDIGWFSYKQATPLGFRIRGWCACRPPVAKAMAGQVDSAVDWLVEV